MKSWMHWCFSAESLGMTLKHLLLYVLVEHCCMVFDIWSITLHRSCLDILLPLQLSLHQAQFFFLSSSFFLTNNKVFYISQIYRALASLAAVIQPNSMSTEEMLLEACTVYSLLVLKHWNTDRNASPPTHTPKSHWFPCTGQFATFPPPLWAKDNVDVTAPPILGAHRFDYRR